MADHSPALQLLLEEVVRELRLAVTPKLLNERGRKEICWHELLGIVYGIYYPCHDPCCYTGAKDGHIYAAAADVIRISHVSARAPVTVHLSSVQGSPSSPQPWYTVVINWHSQQHSIKHGTSIPLITAFCVCTT